MSQEQRSAPDSNEGAPEYADNNTIPAGTDSSEPLAPGHITAETPPHDVLQGEDYREFMRAMSHMPATLQPEQRAAERVKIIEGILRRRADKEAAEQERQRPVNLHRGQTRMAYRLAEKYSNKLRHIDGLGWQYWDSKRWAEDRTGHAHRAVHATLRQALADSLGDTELRQDVRKCESASGIEGVLAIAATLSEFSYTIDEFDADPYLINCTNGTLDLHTLQLRPHNPADNITRVTMAAWNPNAEGPVWNAFLNRSLPDPEVRGFLQRYVGLALAGAVLEHILAILLGEGRNGKGAFYTATNQALGDYACTAEPDLFMHRQGAHPTGEMDLRGRRWVVVSENDRDRRLAEATVKRLTGGDTIKARRLYKEFVEFKPSHTAALVTNHLPQVSGDDPAIWARLRVIPFDVVIPESERDPHLPEKLSLELEAILAWAVDGWVEYQQRGLAAPDAVRAATDKYHRDSDAVARFIEEECDTGPECRDITSALHRRWQAFAAAEGIAPMGQREFGRALDRLGYPVGKSTGSARPRLGIQASQTTTAQLFDGTA